MSLKISTIAIFGGVGASLALGISVFTLSRPTLDRAERAEDRLHANVPVSCGHPQAGKEIQSIAQEIRADGVISISPIAPGLRLGEREAAMESLGAAVKLWNSALTSASSTSATKFRPVQLVVSEDISDPDIQIEFSRVPYTAGQPVAGSIRWQDASESRGGSSSGQHTLVMTVGTCTSQGDQNSAAAVANTIAHQLGHSLGLSDLPDTGGVMDSASHSAGLRSVTDDDIVELTAVLSGTKRAKCRNQPNGRRIY